MRQKISSGPGFEPGSPALHAGAITTKPPRRYTGPSRPDGRHETRATREDFWFLFEDTRDNHWILENKGIGYHTILVLLYVWVFHIGLGDVGVTCSPPDPRFAGSNPAEVDEFFQDLKIPSTSPPGRTLSWGSRVWDVRHVKEPQVWKKIGLWAKFNQHIPVLVIVSKFGGA